MNEAPKELLQCLEGVLSEAWQSPGGMIIDTLKCEECKSHWRVMICPAVREVMGGAQDGENVFARFVLNINKLMRAFDKRPKVVFDTAQGHSVPHIMAIGRIKGYKCDVSVMCCPPANMDPQERVYVAGPKTGTVEVIEPVERDDE